ncbi:MAG TPA: metallophosphoesterase [Vicinamibacterales bacterium]|nr:metallophosphoesterase [Vicinamibacterales bacterium]
MATVTTIAHLSDLHFGRVDSRVIPSLIDTIAAAGPDLVVVSGDLTQRARRHQFRDARRFLDRLPGPLLVVPGNHDVPLFNLAARFLDPFGGYRRHIQPDLEPIYESGTVVAVGLNSARTVPFHGGGRLNESQVELAAKRLQAAPDGAIKIVVTHHPFDLPATHGDQYLIGRSDMAMRRLADAGADVFLAGHLHVSHAAHSAARYQIAGHSAVVVQAGTISTRRRGEVNAINVLRVDAAEIDVERYSWDDARQAFAPSWNRTFIRTSDGWY